MLKNNNNSLYFSKDFYQASLEIKTAAIEFSSDDFIMRIKDLTLGSNDDNYRIDSITSFRNLNFIDGGDGFDWVYLSLPLGNINYEINLNNGSWKIGDETIFLNLSNVEGLYFGGTVTDKGVTIYTDPYNAYNIWGTEYDDRFHINNAANKTYIIGNKGNDKVIFDNPLSVIRTEGIFDDQENEIVVYYGDSNDYTVLLDVDELQVNGITYKVDDYPNYTYFPIIEEPIEDKDLGKNIKQQLDLKTVLRNLNYSEYVGIEYTFTSSNSKFDDQIFIENGVITFESGNTDEFITSTITVTANLTDGKINIDESLSGSSKTISFKLRMADNDELSSNTITGTSGDDVLNGTNENEVFVITDGFDKIDGGGGTDTIFIDENGYRNIIRYIGDESFWGNSNSLYIKVNEDEYTRVINVEKINNNGVEWSLNEFPNYGYFGIGSKDVGDITVNDNASSQLDITDYLWSRNYPDNVGIKYTYTSSGQELSDQISLSSNGVFTFNAGSEGKKFTSSITVTAELVGKRVNINEDWEGSKETKTFFVTMSDDDYSPSDNSSTDNLRREEEPNDLSEDANSLTLNNTITGNLSNSSDQDLYRINIDRLSNIEIEFGSPLETSEYFFEVVVFDGDKVWAWKLVGADEKFSVVLEEGPYDIYVRSILEPYPGFENFSSSDYTLNVKVLPNIEYSELEPNGAEFPATPIILNEEFVGNLSTSDDIDGFFFSIEEPGNYKIYFNSPINSNENYFYVVVSNSDEILFQKSSGQNFIFPISLQEEGSYFINVLSDRYWGGSNYDSGKYGITIRPTSESFNVEVEPNDIGYSATPIKLGEKYTGQLSDNEDYDGFRFEINEPKEVEIIFDSPISSEDSYFVINVNQEGSVVSRFFTGKDSSFKTYLSEPGIYYVAVTSDYAWELGGYEGKNYSDKTYGITVNANSTNLRIESEPNNTLATATPLKNISEIYGSITGTEGSTDIDWFEVEIDTEGYFKVEFEPTEKSSKDDYRVALTTKDVEPISKVDSGGNIILEGAVAEGGKYYIYVGGTKSTTYKLNVTEFKGTPNKEIEWNDRSSNATPVKKDIAYSGQLHNDEDADWFAINLKAGTKVTVDFRPPTGTDEPYYRVSFGNNKYYFVDDTIGTRSILETTVEDDGTYYLYVTSEKNWTNFEGGNGYYHDDGQYRFIIKTESGSSSGSTSSDDWEPNDLLIDATPIFSGNNINARLSSTSDQDIFKINIPSQGRVNYKFTPPNGTSTDTYNLEILDPAGYIIDNISVKNITEFSIDALISGSYFIVVTSGDNFNSGNYSLVATFEKASVISKDEFEPNETFNDASNISIGENIIGRLSDENDIDFFKFTPQNNGVLTVNFDSPSDSWSPFFSVSLWSYETGYKKLDKIISGFDIEISESVKKGVTYYLKVTNNQEYINFEDYNFTTKLYSSDITIDPDILGTSFDDVIEGNSSDNFIDPKSGDDIIKGKQGEDTLILDVTSNKVEIRSLFNFDNYIAVFGKKNADIYSLNYKRLLDVENIKFVDKTISISSNNNSLTSSIKFGSKGTEKIIGTNSNDLIDPIGGQHFIDGKSGSDKVFIFDKSSNFYINTLEGITELRSKSSGITYKNSIFHLKSVEKVTFSNKEISLDASANNYISGSPASDNLKGTSGSDIFDPFGGSDIIDGRGGNDKVIIFRPSSDFNKRYEGAKYILEGKSSASEYAGQKIILENIETIVFSDRSIGIDTPANFKISENWIEVREGGSSVTVEVSLTQRPIKAVTINIEDNSGDITLSTNSLRFTSSNWSTPKLVSISAVDDSLVESIEQIKIDFTVLSDDTKYKSIEKKSLDIQIIDNDQSGFDIEGTVWSDDNQNGERDTNEAALSNWLIYIDTDKDGKYDIGEPKTYSNENGDYVFSNIEKGTYIVSANIPLGWVLTTPDRINTSPTNLDLTSSGIKGTIDAPFSSDLRTTLGSVNDAADSIGLDTFRSDSRFDDIDGSGYTVVVIDTGIDLDHSYFEGRIIHHYNYYEQRKIINSDKADHGTHVAGIIGASGGRYSGIAPGVNFVIFDVFDDDETGTNSFIYDDALRWTINNAEKYNIVAVNMSLGGGNDAFAPYKSLYDRLEDVGVVVVAASGNSFWFEFDENDNPYPTNSEPGIGNPASYRDVFSVGALWDNSYSSIYTYLGTIFDNPKTNLIASTSQRHPTLLDIFAPGSIGSAKDGGGFEDVTTNAATSYAAPIVTGIVVLAQQIADTYLGRRLGADELKELIKITGVDIYDGVGGGSDPNEISGNWRGEIDNEGIKTYSYTPTNASYKVVNVKNLAEAILELTPIGSYRVRVENSDISGSNFGFYPSSTDVATTDSDYIVGSNRADNLYAGGGNDTILGYGGNDYISGGSGDDIINGGSGNDRIDAGIGKDQVDGGIGSDTLILSYKKSSVTVSSNEFGYRAKISDGNYVDFKNIETIKFLDETLSASQVTTSANSAPNFLGSKTSFSTADNSQITVDLDDLFNDPEGQDITFLVNTSSNLISFNSSTSVITFTPNNTNISISVRVTASDTLGLSKTQTLTFSNTKKTVTYTGGKFSLEANIDSSKPSLKSHTTDVSNANVVNMTSSNDLIIIDGNTDNYRGLSGDDTYFLSDLIPSNDKIAIIDTAGNNIIQIPDNTWITKSIWTSDAVRLTLSNNKTITINGADKFTFDIGGNVFAGDNGSLSTFSEFAAAFNIDVENLSGAESNNEGFYIGSEDTISYVSDEYKISQSGYDQSKAILNEFTSDFTKFILNFTSGDNVIALTSSGTKRGLAGDDTYIVSELISSNSKIDIVDTAGSNTIQFVDNTRFISSKWAADAFQLTLSNSSVLTINGADNFTYEVGANIATGDEGTSLTFPELAALFGVSTLPSDNSNTLDGSDLYII